MVDFNSDCRVDCNHECPVDGLTVIMQLTDHDCALNCDHDYAVNCDPEASVAHMDAPSDWRPGGCWFSPCQGRQHSFAEIDHEVFSMVILSLQLIQEGQLSVSGKRICTILVNCLED